MDHYRRFLTRTAGFTAVKPYYRRFFSGRRNRRRGSTDGCLPAVLETPAVGPLEPPAIDLSLLVKIHIYKSHNGAIMQKKSKIFLYTCFSIAHHCQFY